MIARSSIGDNDRLLTLMTRDRGVIRAFAVGAKSIKSRRGSATELLSYSNFNIDKKGDTYKIIEAAPNKVFFGAGSDVVTLSVAQYFCELCAFFGPSDESSNEFLRVILNSLYFMTDKKADPALIKAITELRVLTLSGYAPNIVGCNECGKYEDAVMYFKVDTGMLYCGGCKRENCIPVNPAVLKAMRHIVFSKLEDLYAFTMPEKDIRLLGDITEKFTVFHSEHRFYALEFYHSVV